MAADKDATVTVGIDGQDSITRAAAAVGDAWRKAGQSISGAMKSIGAEVSGIVGAIARDVTNVATSAAQINFSAGANSARELGINFTRFAVGASKDVDTVRGKFDALSKQKVMPEAQLLGIASGLRDLTYDADFAVNSIGGIADEAEAIGKTPQQLLPLAASLHNVYGVSGDVTKAMGEIDAMVEKTGNSGGIRAMHDQLLAADGVMMRFQANAKDTAAILATLGKGYTPQQAQQGQGAILGAIASNRLGVEWLLRGTGQLGRGESVLNEKGEIADQIGTIEKVRAGLIKRYGEKRAMQVARMTFGDTEGTMLMRWNAAEARGLAAGAAGAASPADRAAQVRASDEMFQTGTELQRARNEREMGARIAKETQGINRQIADNPALAPLAQAGANLAAKTAEQYPVATALAAAIKPGAQIDAKQRMLESGQIRRREGWAARLGLASPFEDVPADQQAGAAAAWKAEHPVSPSGADSARAARQADELADKTGAATAKHLAPLLLGGRAPMMFTLDDTGDAPKKGVATGKRAAARQ